MKQLDRLLLFQGNRCFFCDEPIPQGEASVEHLVATTNGGNNHDDNCVACCKALNSAFGNRPYKEKLRAILSHRGQFTCPRSQESAPVVYDESKAATDLAEVRLKNVVKNLTKPKSTRPRKTATLKNAVASICQNKATVDEIDALIAAMVERGHITIENDVVKFHLPDKLS